MDSTTERSITLPVSADQEAATHSQTEEDQAIIDRYLNHVKPFWEQRMTQGLFIGVGGVEIHYAYVLHPKPLGSIAISSGRVETLIKYKELIYNLYHSGYSVFIHDHRGQGLSGRMTNDPEQGYVRHFDDFVTDFKRFYDSVITPNTEHKPKLLCHSMGGAIGSLYVMDHPDDFEQVAFSAPMFGVRPVMPSWLARLMVGTHQVLNSVLDSQPWYFWGQSGYEPEPFSTNPLTHSEARYQLFRQEYENVPSTKLGGVTGKWLAAALQAMRQIAAHAGEIRIPALVLQASEDSIVDNHKQSQVAANIPNCRIELMDGACHEILMESDAIRTKAIRSIHRFFIEG